MLNYHHLRIFWSVAREGGLRQAGHKLGLTQPTLSAQIRQLEVSLGRPLFMRAGRRLVLTEMGETAMRYAEEIFSLGGEMKAAFEKGNEPETRRLHVGIVDSLPKSIAREILRPIWPLVPSVRVVCHDGELRNLAQQLAVHHLDVLLTDEPLIGDQKMGAFNHPAGQTRLALCGIPKLRKRYEARFPCSLRGVPMLMPSPRIPLRRLLDAWFSDRQIEPVIVAEFDDATLMINVAMEGFGLAPIHAASLVYAQKHCKLEEIGKFDGLIADFYLVSKERKLKNVAAVAMTGNGLRSLEAFGSNP